VLDEGSAKPWGGHPPAYICRLSIAIYGREGFQKNNVIRYAGGVFLV